jgi:hypoxanthine phosphoribosyltransferase
VHVTEWDLQILRRNSKSTILVVDDAVDNRTTITAVTKFINSLGIKKFNFVYLRDAGAERRAVAISH